MFLSKRAEVNGTILLPPTPFVLPTTGTFDGDDGKWSTFFINIGASDNHRGQNFKVIPSTSSSITIVPREASWCDEDCAKRRGVQQFDGKQNLGFDQSASQSWKTAGIYDFPFVQWWNETVGGTWGVDSVGLGESSTDSLVLGEQYVGLSQDENVFLGSFGLAAGQVAPAGAAKSTFLVNFDGFDQIASTSYGYTAGASYRNNQKGVTGSLVLGGYDRSRMKDQGISIGMVNERNTSLVVGVQSILYTPAQGVEANTFSFTERGFLATIDSTLPFLELPDDIINKFVDRFRLGYDEDRNLYTVNDSSHNFNTQQNAVVSFKIGDGPQDSAQFATVELPYSAFDQEASAPLYDDAQRYFPIRKSKNGAMVLGRTFLQEAYIVVDYERSNFTVAPAAYSDPMPDRDLVTIFNKTYVLPTSSNTPAPAGSKGGLAPGAIAGIVVGVVLIVVLGAVGAFFWYRRRRTQQQQQHHPVKEVQEEKGSDIDTMVAGNEVKHRRVSELSGSQPAGSPKPSVGGYYGGGDVKEFPPISEMSPESPPAELYSPPAGSLTPYSEGTSDYFIAGNKVRGRSPGTSPGTPAAPLAELPGDDGGFQVGGQHFNPVMGTSRKSNIDEIMSRPEKASEKAPSEKAVVANVPPEKEGEEEAETGTSLAKEEDKVASEQPSSAKEEEKAEDEEPKSKDTSDSDETKKDESEPQTTTERRPSHTRGLSDITVQSESTAVSQPTPEELEQWAMGGNESRRPLSQ